ncbi:MAG: hypothetical protein D6743_14150 [Calditrichaeota bacterium]|nr:MAG: hypothetical protein D6743_14150 [Calditrichota bacterium]
MKKERKLLTVLGMLLALGLGCDVGVNKTIYVEDGETRTTSLNTVNGNIIIGRHCKVRGDCRAVNGSIEVGDDSEVRDLTTVNGHIDVGENVRVDGAVETVNGGVECDAGAEVKGNVHTVNGRIRLVATTVRHDVKTVNGDMLFRDKTRVQGDVIVQGKVNDRGGPGRLVIEVRDSVVEGDVVVKDPRRDVRVLLVEGGRVLGKVRNAEVVEE